MELTCVGLFLTACGRTHRTLREVAECRMELDLCYTHDMERDGIEVSHDVDLAIGVIVEELKAELEA